MEEIFHNASAIIDNRYGAGLAIEKARRVNLLFRSSANRNSYASSFKEFFKAASESNRSKSFCTEKSFQQQILLPC